MERLLQELVQQLHGPFAVSLFGPAGCAAHAPPGASCSARPHRPLPRFLLQTLWDAWRAGRQQPPDLILCGSGLLAPVGWLLGRLLRVPVMSYLHGLDVVADHPVYQRVWVPAIRQLDHVVTNSAHTRSLALAAGVSADRITVVHPGVRRPAAPNTAALAAFCQTWQLQGPVLLSVGRLTRRKGLEPFVREVLPRLLEHHPGLTLLVVGGAAVNAAQATDQGVQGDVTAAAAAAGLAGCLRWLGDVDEDTLQLAYASADVLVFPVLALPGDVEGFGMVALEAAAAGCPTVAYAVGGVPEAVAAGQSGLLVAAGDAAGFAQAVQTVLAGALPRLQEDACRSHAERFSWLTRGAALTAACLAVLAAARSSRRI